MEAIKRLMAASLLLAGLLVPVAVSAADQCGTSSMPRDCDEFSIMWGGAWSKSEFLGKVAAGDGHNSAANLQQIYYHENRGITEANFKSANTVDGTVLADGRVFVNGKLVATQAAVQGRNFLSGSTKDGSVWSRPIPDPHRPASDTAAWVNMEGGVYHYAIIKACGNTVRGKPVPKPSPSPLVSHTPTPTPTPTPEQSFECVKLTPTQPDKAGEPTRFRFTVTHKESNVTVTGFHYVFSDNTTADSAADVPFTERTVKSGSLTAHAQVQTSAGTTELSEACSATVNVTVATPTQTPQVLGAQTLPDTGAAALLGGTGGLAAIGWAGRYYVRSRKSLLKSLRDKAKL